MNQSSDPVLDAVLAQYLVAVEEGDESAIEQLFEKHPQYKNEIEQFAENKRLIDRIAQTRAPGSSSVSSATSARSPIGTFVPPSVSELQQILEQFEVIELIGQGAMGAVYKARQTKLDRIVALKVLPSHTAADPLFAERFAREARAMAKLIHSNIVTIFDFGECEGCCFLVMEYVDGVNLRQAITSGQMNPQEALAIVPQLCDALFYAHQNGIVHRDIKPENILLDKNGVVKIADFGLAKMLNETAATPYLTATQQVLGTLRYMAPEQLEGSRDIDHRADIYSLGVVFYELLTGQLPVGRFEMPSETADVDSRLDEVVARTLERSPDRRYQQASEIKTDIHGISSGDLPVAAKSSSTGRTGPGTGNADESTFYEFSWVSLIFGVSVVFALVAPFTPALRMTFSTDSRDNRFEDIYYIIVTKCMDEPAYWFGFFLTLAAAVWFLLTLQKRFLASRGLIAVSAGLAILHASATTALLNPFPISFEYGNILDDNSTYALSRLMSSSRFRDLSIVFHGLGGYWITLISGLLLTILGVLEFHTAGFWKTRKSEPQLDADSFALPGTMLKIAGWASIVFAFSWWVIIFIYQLTGSTSPDIIFSGRSGGLWSALMHTFYALAFGPVIISGGNAMRKLQNRSMATAACILAMVPLNYAAAIGIPAGILGLYMLNSRADVDHTFAANRLDAAKGRARLRVAGTVQFICSIIALVIWGVIIVISLNEYGVLSGRSDAGISVVAGSAIAQDSSWGPGTPISHNPINYAASEIILASLMFAVVVLLVTLWVVSSYLFMKLRSYKAKWVSVVLGLIPHSPVSVITIPLSLWIILFCRQKFSGSDPEIQSARDFFSNTKTIAGAKGWSTKG